MIPVSTLHHIGLATPHIKEEARHWQGLLGCIMVTPVIHDPIQRVNVAFIGTGRPSEVLIELVEPAAPDSPVNGHIRRGGGFYHLCYEVKNLEEQLVNCHALGGLVVQAPVKAAAFEGRRIAWCYFRNQLVEYVERS